MRAWEKRIRTVTPYVPGEQPNFKDMIKLNTNENPYPPSKKVESLLETEHSEKLRLYPDTESTVLKKSLAQFHKISEDQIFVGVGSDDVLAMSFLTFFASETPILFPDITYSFYEVWADLYHIPYVRPMLTDDFRIRKEDYYVANGGIVIANPNAPTSILEPLSVIEDILLHNTESIVIIDEAYVDFGGVSALSLLNQYENLLVVRTFSKSRSLAGARIGYAVGNPVLIRALNAVKNSYNSYTMNRLSIMLGAASVEDEKYFYETTNKIIETRNQTATELKALGFKMPDSSTNFLFITHPKVRAEALFNYLKEQHIFVRYFALPRINQYLRVTIGTEPQMQCFIKAVQKYLQSEACVYE